MTELEIINSMDFGGFIGFKYYKLPYFIDGEDRVIVGRQEDWEFIEDYIKKSNYKYIIYHG